MIPLNMRDGSLICTGLGNKDMNFLRRTEQGENTAERKTENSFTLSEFKASMEGIFTTSISRGTLDECPMAYKDAEEILQNIKSTVVIDKIIRPVYNFKSERA